MGGIGWGLGQNFPLIDTAGAISIKQQWWPGGQKTEASSEVVNAFFNGVEFKSWAPVPIGFLFHMAEIPSFGVISILANCFSLYWKRNIHRAFELVVCCGRHPCILFSTDLVFW